MKKLGAEFIGTFALVFAGTGAIVINELTNGIVTHVGISLTFGLVIMAMINAVGDTSGAHFNPAVTFAFWISRKLPGRFVLPYIISQCAGALLASAILLYLFGNQAHLGSTLPSGPVLQSFILEVIITFFLMYVIFSVATGAKEKGMIAGISIGGTVALASLFAGPISGASMNPARSLGPAIVSGEWSNLWIYLTAPFIGSTLSVFACRFSQDKCCEMKEKFK